MILRHKWLFVRQKWSFMRQKLSFVRQNMLYLRKINITFDWIDGFSKFKNSQKGEYKARFLFGGRSTLRPPLVPPMPLYQYLSISGAICLLGAKGKIISDLQIYSIKSLIIP